MALVRVIAPYSSMATVGELVAVESEFHSGSRLHSGDGGGFCRAVGGHP
jgi:hypothetical protein